MGKAVRSKLKSRQTESQHPKKPTAEIKPEAPVEIKESKLEITKKDLKKKQRHEAWLEKLDHSYAVKKQQKKKEIKKKNNHGMDLSSIEDILNTIQFKPKKKSSDTMITDEQVKKEPVIPTNKIKSKKAKKQSEMQEILRMQKLMQHGQFKQNPLSTILQHVQNTFQ